MKIAKDRTSIGTIPIFLFYSFVFPISFPFPFSDVFLFSLVRNPISPCIFANRARNSQLYTLTLEYSLFFLSLTCSLFVVIPRYHRVGCRRKYKEIVSTSLRGLSEPSRTSNKSEKYCRDVILEKKQYKERLFPFGRKTYQDLFKRRS